MGRYLAQSAQYKHVCELTKTLKSNLNFYTFPNFYFFIKPEFQKPTVRFHNFSLVSPYPPPPNFAVTAKTFTRVPSLECVYNKPKYG